MSILLISIWQVYGCQVQVASKIDEYLNIIDECYPKADDMDGVDNTYGMEFSSDSESH